MTTVHASPDYSLQAHGSPPPGYPAEPLPDAYSFSPFAASFAARRRAFLEHVLRNPAPATFKAPYYETARLAAGGMPHEGVLWGAVDYVNSRKDCSDFVLHSLLRLLYQPGCAEKLSSSLRQGICQAVLNFKYWASEPGIDSMCSWTENHYILFTSAAYLAGQMFPDEVFTNSGESGREKMTRNKPRILRWLNLRFRTGFSEWLSHVYYDEDLAALLNLVDFCEDDDIQLRATMVVDLLLLDMALNHFKGSFCSTHGRSYENTKQCAAHEGTIDTFKLAFGMGIFSGFDNMSAILLALSQRYELPKVLYAIANDLERWEMETRQRMGIRIAEAERWGLNFEDFESGMTWLTLEAYAHPRTIALTLRMFDAFNWWDNAFFAPFKTFKRLLNLLRQVGGLGILARFLERDVCRNTREEINLYTYRTPDYMLSTAQDYRKGYGGDQQHIWQATLAPDAVCFTTHPAKLSGASPSYWTGSGLLPRAAQVKNVCIVIYKLEKMPALYVPVRHFYTHAWLPQDQFDEVIERESWVFARKAQGYLALRSMQPYRWNSYQSFCRSSALPNEIIAPGARNIWICELGRQAVDGSFESFIEKIVRAPLTFSGLNVLYHSPSLGEMRFGWEGPLRVKGVEIPLSGYPRYDAPYVQAPFDAHVIEARLGGDYLRLDWKALERRT